MSNTPAFLELENESLEGRDSGDCDNDSGDDAAYVDGPRVRSQPPLAPVVVFNKGL
jgi:hypothetical protein